MTEYVEGNILEANVEALVNTVNTVGVMGKGIALQFKRAYPNMFKAYEASAKKGEIRLGQMDVHRTGALSGPRYVINFPTKKHWRARSRLDDIQRGLTDLVRVVDALELKSIAVLPLGCGNGGLDWRDVATSDQRSLRSTPRCRCPRLSAGGRPGCGRDADENRAPPNDSPQGRTRRNRKPLPAAGG
jgi:O-acetyl-ADP-ribose deacetylase (regulator of RNase III)